MSATEGAPPPTYDLPTFELEFGFDDREEPRTVTVFDPDARDVSTTWLTIEVEHAVSLETVA